MKELWLAQWVRRPHLHALRNLWYRADGAVAWVCSRSTPGLARRSEPCGHALSDAPRECSGCCQDPARPNNGDTKGGDAEKQGEQREGDICAGGGWGGGTVRRDGGSARVGEELQQSNYDDAEFADQGDSCAAYVEPAAWERGHVHETGMACKAEDRAGRGRGGNFNQEVAM